MTKTIIHILLTDIQVKILKKLYYAVKKTKYKTIQVQRKMAIYKIVIKYKNSTRHESLF